MDSFFWERERESVCVCVCEGWGCQPALWSGLWFFKVWALIFSVSPTAPSPLCPEAAVLPPLIAYPHPVSYPLMFPYPISSPCLSQTESDVWPPLPALSKWPLWILVNSWITLWNLSAPSTHLSQRISGGLIFQHLTGVIRWGGIVALCCLACLNDECTCVCGLFRQGLAPKVRSAKNFCTKVEWSLEKCTIK